MLALVGIDPRVIDIGGNVEFVQVVDDARHLGVAVVGAVFLEGKAQYQHAQVSLQQALAAHQADELVDHVLAHAVVDAAAGQDHFRMVADLFRLVGQVIGINADAVPADQARADGHEVPLGARGLQHLDRVDADAIADHRQFVGQGDVEVALGVFHHLGRLGHADRAGAVGAGCDHAAIERIHEIGRRRRRSAGDLEDVGQLAQLVARVDPFRAVAAEEIDIVGKARKLLQDRYAEFVGATGVDRAFVDHDIAALQHAGDCPRGAFQGFQVRVVVPVQWGGHGDDEYVALRNICPVGGEAEQCGRRQFFRGRFPRLVVPGLEVGNAACLDVDAHGRVLLPEGNRHRQADIAKAHHAHTGVLQLQRERRHRNQRSVVCSGQ